MAASSAEFERRRSAALAAIRLMFSNNDDSEGPALFVSHHLNEMDEDFWLKHCGVANPESAQVLDLLVLQSHWSCDLDGEIDDDGIDTFDFTLPDDATNYIISVSFNENGDVSGVTMES